MSLTGLPTALSDKSLSEAGLVRGSVVTMRDNETAMQGYARMATKRLLAIPVVDTAGLVVGTLSASDLRGLSKNTLEFVRLPALDFVEKMVGVPADQ